jgi:hypothetical protein
MSKPGSHSHGAERISLRSGILKRQGNRAMMKNLAFAPSITMLVAISGQALAGTAAPKARQVRHAFNAFDPAIATQTVEPNVHRYHGGPKSNY